MPEYATNDRHGRRIWCAHHAAFRPAWQVPAALQLLDFVYVPIVIVSVGALYAGPPFFGCIIIVCFVLAYRIVKIRHKTSGAPNLLGFEPVTIPRLRRRWLDHDEHSRWILG
jgi:hypothetical protein